MANIFFYSVQNQEKFKVHPISLNEQKKYRCTGIQYIQKKSCKIRVVLFLLKK